METETARVASLQWKDKGNTLFAQRRFGAAADCYTEAIAAMKNDDGHNNLPDDDDAHLLVAVSRSNRSSCYYEAGDYANAITDARDCIDILDNYVCHSSPKRAPLLAKNLWRLARALHYHDASNEGGEDDDDDDACSKNEIASTLLRLKDVGDKTLSPKASKMLRQLTYYEGIPPSQLHFEPTLLRARLQDPFTEYYHFGHDDCDSLLRNDEIESQSIHLRDLPEDELSLAFLFGGVGDARHPMATLLDAHHQYLSLSPSRREKFRLHMTLNDINSQLLAKDALVLVLSYEIGRLARFRSAGERSAGEEEDTNERRRTPFDEEEPCLLAMVIMYGTMGYASPPVVHKKMIECIKLWFTDSTREKFLAAFPWLLMSQYTWDEIVAKMATWVDPSDTQLGYHPDLPSVRESLDNIRPMSNDRSKEALQETVAQMGGNETYESNMGRHVDKHLSIRRQKLEKMEIPESIMAMIKEAKGDDISEEEAREAFIELQERMQDQGVFEASYTMASPLDKLFFELTHAILPPRTSPIKELSSALPLLKEHNDHQSEEEAAQLILRSKRTIHDEFVANPVQTDPSFYRFTGGKVDYDKNNPVQDFCNHYFTDAVQSYMLEKPVDTLDECEEAFQDPDKVPSNDGFARNDTLFYWNVGRALIDLSGKVSLELALGNMVDLRSRDREKDGLPTQYNRISLSNCPDYVGMLSVFTTVAPMLAKDTDAITSSLRSNVLLNTGLWSSYDDYLFSTMGLTHKQVGDIFGLGVAGEQPDVWNLFNTWERIKKDDGAVLSIEQLRLWLHTLFLSIVFPPDRDTNSSLREEKPSSVGMFLLALAACINDFGVPAHNVFSILDELLGKSTLKTKAMLSNNSPASSEPENNPKTKTYNISAFRSELANQTAIFIQNNLLSNRVLSTDTLPKVRASLYELNVNILGIDPPTHEPDIWEYTVGARANSFSLGFLLRKRQDGSSRGLARYDITSGASDGGQNPMAMMMAMMGGGQMPGMMKQRSKLRQDLLDRGALVGHVFSCCMWHLDRQLVYFWMCEDMFEQFKDYEFSLIRTDGWFVIPHKHIRLGDATRYEQPPAPSDLYSDADQLCRRIVLKKKRTVTN